MAKPTPTRTIPSSFHTAASLKFSYVTRCAAITPLTEIVALQSSISAINTINVSSIPYAIHILLICVNKSHPASTVIKNEAILLPDSFIVSHFEFISESSVIVPADTA